MKKYHHCVKFTYPLSFQTRIPKVDQHTGGKWLIHGTKHRKDKSRILQSFLNFLIGAVVEDCGVFITTVFCDGLEGEVISYHWRYIL